MANEVAAQALLRMKISGEDPQEIDTLTQYFDMTGTEFESGIISVGYAAKENVAKGDVGTIGWVYLKNLDSTNFIAAGDDADNPSIKMKAGEFFLGRWNATNISVIADTAACRMQFLMLED